MTCSPMVNTGLSEVIGSWNTMAMPGPRMRCMRASESSVSDLAGEADLAGRDAGWRLRQQAHDGERGDALAAAGFADDAEDFAFVEREARRPRPR